jgi:hypothetical protein
MIGNTVLEPPILMLAALRPARWARESAWASGEVARTAVNAAAIRIESCGSLGRQDNAMTIGSRTGRKGKGK